MCVVTLYIRHFDKETFLEKKQNRHGSKLMLLTDIH